MTFNTNANVLVISWWGTWYGPAADDVVVPVGIPIEWDAEALLYVSGASVRIRSIEVPPGGASFDSQTWDYSAGRFRFTPNGAGIWTYVVEYQVNPDWSDDVLTLAAR